MPQNPAPAIRKNLVENFKVHGALYLIFKYFASLKGIRMRCFKVTTRQCRERCYKVFRRSIPEQNHFRRSFFVKSSCHLLLESPSYPTSYICCFSLRAAVALGVWIIGSFVKCVFWFPRQTAGVSAPAVLSIALNQGLAPPVRAGVGEGAKLTRIQLRL